MCQNNNLHRASRIGGTIILSTNNALLFSVGNFTARPDTQAISPKISLERFKAFARYCQRIEVLKIGSCFANCDAATMAELYKDFEEIEQNKSLTALLFRNNIYPSPREENDLDCVRGRNSQFNFWLDKTRRWLQLHWLRVYQRPQKRPASTTPRAKTKITEKS